MKIECQNGEKCNFLRFFAFYGSTVRDTGNFARDVIWGAENLLQNGFSFGPICSRWSEQIEFEQWKIPIFTILRETVLDMGKIDRSTLVPREILYPYVWSNVPISMKILYSYHCIYKPRNFRNISKGNRRREEPVADLNSATSKTP